VTSCSTQAGYDRTIGCEVLRQVHFFHLSHQLLQTFFGASMLSPRCKLGRAPPARKDSLLLS
jgi:hypothetical protein